MASAWKKRLIAQSDLMALHEQLQEKGKKIVFTWQWDDDEAWENRSSVVTIELFERRGGTELRFRHEQLPSEESRDRHNEGWNSLLDGLEQFISR